jgi:ceramide glucosyltransferase
MLHVLLGLAVIGLISATVFAGMVLAAAPGYLRERRRALEQLEARPGFTPPLTLLKPVHGAEPGLEAHLATFLSRIIPNMRFFSARASTPLFL